MKANTLNGLRPLFCSFDRRNPQCTWLVDQLCMCHEVCTCFYTFKPLVDQALSVVQRFTFKQDLKHAARATMEWFRSKQTRMVQSKSIILNQCSKMLSNQSDRA
ncbi:hypothetical protein ATANTOWER_010592 [Ataeniobius toweri]|uniref:Uncharacterized protein n=1 Tax=Ataeniobius toweri TaxID=208326 RepID=A0ABU7BNY5_9TELE|nr:hypothetical protein [Ataeniobius toweri]